MDPKGRILLVKRSVEPKKGNWCLPGGFIETGESPEKAGLRELFEETGLRGRISQLIGVITHPGTLYKSILMIGFLVKDPQGSPRPGDDAAEVAWFSLNEMPPVAFAGHESFIRIVASIHADPEQQD